MTISKICRYDICEELNLKSIIKMAHFQINGDALNMLKTLKNRSDATRTRGL